MLPHALIRAISRSSHLARPLAVLTLAALVSSACDKVPLVAPAGTVITLVPATNVLPINGNTDIVAVLIENGSTSTGTGTGASTASAGTPVHNGTVVTFTTSLGRIEPAEARTHNGRVTVKLTADGRSGRAVVTAFSGGAKQTVEVVIGAAAAERVLVTATPTLLPSIGGTSTVTARVEDASGNPLAGVPVAFTTSAGTLSAVSALTGDGGAATVTLSTTTAAKVTATAGGKAGTVDLTLRTAATINLTTPAQAITVGAPVFFTIEPGAGATLRDVVLNFGDGRVESIGTLSSSTVRSHFFESEGIFVVRVTAADVDGAPLSDSGSVAVTGFTFNLSVSPAGAQSLGTVLTFSLTGLPAGVPISRVEWDFGNGVTRTSQGTSTTYEFPARGTWTVRATLVPEYGPSRSVTVVVSVT